MSDVKATYNHFIEAEENALMDFQFAILDELEARDWSQKQLAEALGVSNSRVSQMLSPDANPTLKLTARALKVLGLFADYKTASAASASEASSREAKSDFRFFEEHAWATAFKWQPMRHTSDAANENFAELELQAA
ncbi:helix-turn-helix domain-containing protein [Aliihoeflea sp. PC F10.4]